MTLAEIKKYKKSTTVYKPNCMVFITDEEKNPAVFICEFPIFFVDKMELNYSALLMMESIIGHYSLDNIRFVIDTKRIPNIDKELLKKILEIKAGEIALRLKKI